jgi:hypothetical protein
MGQKTRAANKAHQQRTKGFGKPADSKIDWAICSYGALRLHKSNKNLKASDFITPGFDPSSVDVTQPQTITTWKDYFFAVSSELADADDKPELVKTNLYTRAVAQFLKRKYEQQMIVSDKATPEWMPLEIAAEVMGDAVVKQVSTLPK